MNVTAEELVHIKRIMQDRAMLARVLPKTSVAHLKKLSVATYALRMEHKITHKEYMKFMQLLKAEAERRLAIQIP